MNYADYRLLKTSVDQGVATVLIDNPPINLFDMPLIEEKQTSRPDMLQGSLRGNASQLCKGPVTQAERATRWYDVIS